MLFHPTPLPPLWLNPIFASFHSPLLLCFLFFFVSSSSSFFSLHFWLPSVWHGLEGLACRKLLLVPSTTVCMQIAVLFFLSSSPSPFVLLMQPGGSSRLHHGSGAVSAESSRPGLCQQRLHSIKGSGPAHCPRTQSAPLSTPGDHNCTLWLSTAIQGRV